MILSINNKLVRLHGKEKRQDQVTETLTGITTVGTQYGWTIPVDAILDCATNGFNISITAHTTQADDQPWGNDYRVFLVKPGISYEYTVLNNITPFVPIDDQGYRGMTISNSQWQGANLSTLRDWKTQGVTEVVLHFPASQTNKFTEPPLCVINYYGEVDVDIKLGLANYLVPPTPPVPDYEYFSFKVDTTATINFDPIFGVRKYFDNSISTDLTTGQTFPSDGSGSNDWPNFSVTQDHIYSFVWSEQDLQTTFGGNLYGNNSGWSDSSSKGYISEIYSLDFWHASDWAKASTYSFSNCTIIPQSSSLIYRGESLTSCSNMFKNAPIQNSIEAFILAMQQACPNLSNTSGCFAGCTTAPDYNYCLTTYPQWF